MFMMYFWIIGDDVLIYCALKVLTDSQNVFRMTDVRMDKLSWLNYVTTSVKKRT